MIFVWIIFICLIVMIIWRILKWKGKDYMTISKEGMKTFKNDNEY